MNSRRANQPYDYVIKKPDGTVVAATISLRMLSILTGKLTEMRPLWKPYYNHIKSVMKSVDWFDLS